MAEIEIFRSTGRPFLKYEGDSVREAKGPKNKNIQNLYMDGVRFYAKEKSRKTEFICFFRAREEASGRSEQFMAVYKGSLESPRDFAKQVDELVQETDMLHSITGLVKHGLKNITRER